jgi:hypothetical protein
MLRVDAMFEREGEWRSEHRSREVTMRAGMLPVGMVGLTLLLLVSPAGARGPGGGPGGAHGNAGGAVRGLERAEEVAASQGVQHGIDKAEQKINTKDNPSNPNTQTKEDIDTTTAKPRPKK